MKPLVLADENIPGLAEQLGDSVQLETLPGRSIAREHLLCADALLVRSVTRVNADLLAGTAVKFVGTATSGYDHIDRAWLAEQGTGFAHAPGSNANSVVEYVLAAVAETGDFLERLLAGGRLGIVGYGHIGRALARRLTALGINHCIYDPWLSAAELPVPAFFEEILSCDVISLHPALTLEAPYPSKHLFDAAALAGLGSKQLLINASRGPVVDNAALSVRLDRAEAPVVVLDVWEYEPRVDAALLEKVRYGSAHIAGYSLDGKLAGTAMLVQALAATLGIGLPSSPAPGRAPLALPALDSHAEVLRYLLGQCYRVADDDRRLRETTLTLPEKAAADNFDRLRRDYPERRELAGSRVRISAGGPDHAALVRALGAEPIVGGGA